jgi:hypothetical protein
MVATCASAQETPSNVQSTSTSDEPGPHPAAAARTSDDRSNRRIESLLLL